MSAERGALQFSEWDTGKRRLRYLYIRSPCAFTLCHTQQAEGHYSKYFQMYCSDLVKYLKQPISGRKAPLLKSRRAGAYWWYVYHVQENLIPMFLGADVVAQTGIRTENHPKLHAKFAKKGLAAKLTFSTDFKFEKLRLPSGVNTLWFYSIQGVFRVAFDLYSRDDQLAVIESLQELWRSRLKDSPLKKCYNLKERLENPDHLAQICSHADQPKAQEQLLTWSSDFIHKEPHVLHSIAAFGTVAEHNYCKSNTSHPPEATSSGVIVQGARNVLDMCTDPVIQLSEQSNTAVLMLFDVICQMLKGQQYMDKMIVSIVQLLDAASYMFDKNSSQKEIPSVYDNKLLFEVSSWLGNRFQSEYECISQQVEEFKRKHIDRISDLPPAEELVSALFPKAMKILLLNWMGLSDEAFVSKLQSEYPILLLILEFANRNLITGVAHVLYSTLICK